MFVLLSSDYSPRYKQDVLRCLAAPIGATVQFRYDKVHVSDSVLKKLNGTFPASAVVSSVATKGIGPLTLVPVRAVNVTSIREHGSTVSITLQMKEIIKADPAKFTEALDKLSGGESPRKRSEEASPEGKYFFEIANLPEGVQQDASLKTWEQTVSLLRDQHAYQDESFFWTIIGLQKEGEHLDSKALHPLPDTLPAGSGFDVLLYHYQPRSGQRPNSRLELSVGPEIDLVVPPDTAVDSRYDLKTWSCRTTSRSQAAHRSWLRIKTPNAWELEIAVEIASAWTRWILRAIVTGGLIAIPSIAALVPQTLPAVQKYELYGVAVLFGFFAALAATYRIERLD
jgi:hypothetical protein